MYTVRREWNFFYKVYHDNNGVIVSPEDYETPYMFQNADTGEITYFDDMVGISINDCLNIDETLVRNKENVKSAYHYATDGILIRSDNLYVYYTDATSHIWYKGEYLYADNFNVVDMIHIYNNELSYITDEGKHKKLPMHGVVKSGMSIGEFKRKIIFGV